MSWENVKATVMSSDDEVESGNQFVVFHVAYTLDDRFLSYASHRINLSVISHQSIEYRLNYMIRKHKQIVYPLLDKAEDIHNIIGKEY